MNEEMKSVMAALDAIEKKMSENASKEEIFAGSIRRASGKAGETFKAAS